jgi:ABC-type uncharacterized transport system substrate-binding protein
MKQASLRAVLAALLLAAAGPAAAHPHVWVDNVLTFVFDGDRLTSLRLTWSFDEFFGTAIIRRFDENRNSRFEPAENDKLQASAFAALKEYGYFTHIEIDGKPVTVDSVRGFQASVRSNQLVYDFTVPLPAPVDPATAAISVSIYDESYFVEASLDANDPVRFDGMTPGRCSFAVRDGEGGAQAFGVAPFQTVTLSCRPAP